MTLNRRSFLAASTALAATTLAAPSIIRAQSPVTVIRLAGPGNPAGRPYGTGPIGALRALELLEEEFASDGIAIEWQFPRGTGPAINEALANRQLDFASYGGLPNLVGRGAGVPTKVLAATGSSPTYVIARTGSGITSLDQVKGRNVTLQRGTIFELSLSQILRSVDLTNSDVTLYDLQGADQLAAIQTGDVDVVVGSTNVLQTVEAGLGEVLYTTKGTVAPGSTFGSFTVHEAFLAEHPEIVSRVLARYLEASRFASLEENREQLIDFFALNGTPREVLAADYEGDDLADRSSPLLDTFYRDNIAAGLEFTLEQRLVRQSFDLDSWIDDTLLTALIADLGYGDVWVARDAQGNPTR